MSQPSSLSSHPEKEPEETREVTKVEQPAESVPPPAVAPNSQQREEVKRPQKRSSRGVRRAHMNIARIDPWSALKISFLLSIGMGIMIVISAVVTWNVLDSMHVFARIQDLLETLGSEPLLELMQYLEFGRILSFSVIVAILDVVLFTFLGVIFALLYNVISMLVGGLHITITDE